MGKATEGWCILRCAGSQTLQLASSLRDAGFEAWTPIEVREVLTGKDRAPVEREVAVIPSFVFANLSDAADLLALSRSPALNYRVWDSEQQRMVTKGHPHFTVFHLHGRRSFVTEAQLGPLRVIEADLHRLTERRREKARCKGPAPRFTAGQVVRIEGGGFDGLDLTVQEANDGKLVKLAKINFRWYKGAFVADSDLPAEVANDLHETIQASADNKLFLACLNERNRQRRSVSESKFGSNYAPKVFEAMPESKRIGKERLEKALDRLFRIDAIERGFLWVLKGEAKPVFGIKEVGKMVPDRAAGAPDTSDNLPITYPEKPITSREQVRKPTDNLPITSDNTPIGTTYHKGPPAEGGEPSLEEGEGQSS